MDIHHLEDIPSVCPLTEVQKGIYLECIENPNSLKYNIAGYIQLPEGTDTNKFSDAVRLVAKAHAIFGVTIKSVGGVLSMEYHESDINITQNNCCDLDSACAEFIKPFDLEKGPLYRFELCLIGNRSVFLFDIHHIIFDGTSLNNFVSDIAKVYSGGVCSEEVLTIFDLANAEQDIEKTDEYLHARQFFKEKLDGVDCDSKPVPDIITDNVKKNTGRVIIGADGLCHDDILKFTKQHNISENALFLGAFAYTLAKFNASDDCFFCTVHNGRRDPRLASAFGMFVKTFPMYYSFDGKTEVLKFLKQVYDDYYNTKQNACISFGELAEQYGANTDIVFVYQDRLFCGAAMGNDVIYPKLSDTGEMPADIDVMLMNYENGYEVMSHFNEALYSKELITSLVRMYFNTIRSMLHCRTLSDICFTDLQSCEQIELINKTEKDYDNSKTLVDLFKSQVEKTPDNICLVYKDKRFSYRETDEITDRLARHLKKCGVGAEKIVGVLIPRCEYMLICSLAVLKAGGAYLPLDPSYPPERLNLMVQDSSAMMLIYSPCLDGIITPDFTGIRMCTDEILTLTDCDIPLTPPKSDDLFVMLYTSGSTGTPKGVMFEHSNALVTAEWVKSYFNINEASRVTAYASYGFDANVFDMYPPIISGAQLHIISDEIRLDFPALKKYFNDNLITHTVMTTQVGRQFAVMGATDTLKHLSVAGEKLTPLSPPDGFKLYNLYGPTEGSIVTSAFCVDKYYKDIPIGKPVDNLKIYVVDKNERLLPVGAVGELWLCGPHVTRGYLNRPEKTREAYGKNPFCSSPGYERVYKTGDIVRLLSDGNLQFVGRRDAQVKVRGFRVELTEIEEVIRRFPNVKDATVAAFDEPSGGKFIAAYIVSDSEISQDELSDFIRAEKPPYMVPAVFMQIDKIPLNQNQKVNKKALPIPKRSFNNIVPPENDTQRKIFDIIADTIGHTDFGITTNIYDAGLTSIGAVKLNVALSETFCVPIRISDIKANDTVKKLEGFLTSAKSQESFDILSDYPITQTQNGIFIECMSAPDTTVYNIPVLIKLGEGVELEQLKKAVISALNAHPYVKTTLFTDSHGNIRAKRNDNAMPDINIIKCDKLPLNSELIRPFTLLNSTLYRIAIYSTTSGNYLFMDIHHIISDGTSEKILFDDISRAYAGEALEPEHFSGFEEALSEQKLQSGDQYAKAKEYWKNLLTGCDTSCLPKKEPDAEDGGAGSIRVFSKESADSVLDFCKANSVTPNAFFNSVFAFVLSRFSGKDSITYSTIYNGRNDSRLSRSVTLLVKTLPVCTEITGDTAITEFIGKMQTQLMDSMSNDACSFAELSSSYGVKADIIFAYQGNEFIFDSLCAEPAEMMEISLDAAKAPISVNVYLNENRFLYVVEYKKDYYSDSFARCLADAIQAACLSFTKCEYIKSVSMLSDSGEASYHTLNDNKTAIENILTHQMFEHYADTSFASDCVIASGEKLSYGELNTLSNIMANNLIDYGVKDNAIIGLLLERTKEVLVTELGIMKSGGAFLPMLPSYPDERIEFCLTNAECPYIITTESIKASKPSLFSADKPYTVLTVEQLISGTNTKNPDLEISPDSLAYCIYTSGSTGTPKGVMITHHNLSNFMQTQAKLYNYYTDKANNGTSLALSSISFDMSILELLLPLCHGKCLLLATDDEFHNPLILRDLMVKYNTQMVTCTPSFMNNSVSIPEFNDAIKGLKTLLVGAEAFPSSLYDALRTISPDLQIVNGYGPTECTICCSTKELKSGRRITIGRPTGNVSMYVLDRFGNILPPYAVGELIICGDGVGSGYVKLPEKNKAAFFELRGLSAYHSGDLVRLNSDSEIDFGGRIDNQVKLRGFRVELDEIEKVMQSYSSVLISKVIVRNNGSEDYLAGFFTADSAVDLDDLTAYMKSRLTYYMVPQVMMQLDKMPLTPNGKIDKNAFPEVKQTKTKKVSRRAPKKSLEQRLCDIFAQVLDTDEVFADDNFFELGGTSLSASKVTMLLMSDNIEVKYGDIFDHPTPELLSEFIETRDKAAAASVQLQDSQNYSDSHPALKYNTVKYAHEVKRDSLGNVLLTGAVGFLGIHILYELLKTETGHIWCMVRRGKHESGEVRLKTMLIYYFSNGFDEELKNRITVIDADITDSSLYDTLCDLPIDTVINCAACVKHFSDNDILEQINVGGVENLISVCMRKNAALVQVSTVSVPGIHTAQSYENQIRMHENELFVIDNMDNKYIISKYHAELKMLDAIQNGLRGKIIRVGNLMGRHSDGEFQINMETNMFMSGIRGFALMGKYPISHMTDPMSFSPVDCTAKAVVLLAGTNDKFTAFNANNRYGFDEMKIIDACNRNGINIYPAPDEQYYAEFRKKLGDENVNSGLNGLAAYDVQGAHSVETDNLFTTNILYRIGFSWPLVDDTYLDRAINSIMTLDYFNISDTENDE